MPKVPETGGVMPKPVPVPETSAWPFGDRDTGTGVWIPKGSKNLFVVNPSGPTTSHIPGAANG